MSEACEYVSDSVASSGGVGQLLDDVVCDGELDCRHLSSESADSPIRTDDSDLSAVRRDSVKEEPQEGEKQASGSDDAQMPPTEQQSVSSVDVAALLLSLYPQNISEPSAAVDESSWIVDENLPHSSSVESMSGGPADDREPSLGERECGSESNSESDRGGVDGIGIGRSLSSEWLMSYSGAAAAAAASSISPPFPRGFADGGKDSVVALRNVGGVSLSASESGSIVCSPYSSGSSKQSLSSPAVRRLVGDAGKAGEMAVARRDLPSCGHHPSLSVGALSASDDGTLSQSKLAQYFGLPGRFRDYKRSLFDHKMSEGQMRLIDTDSQHTELKQRLPHKISPEQFAFRVLLMTFHFVLRDGKIPSYWTRVRADVLMVCLPSPVRRLFSLEVATRAHQLMEEGLDAAAAIQRAQSLLVNAF